MEHEVKPEVSTNQLLISLLIVFAGIWGLHVNDAMSSKNRHEENIHLLQEINHKIDNHLKIDSTYNHLSSDTYINFHGYYKSHAHNGTTKAKD